eukprot:ANDGO_07868.mRNA.1 KH domain-containing protein At2g38610
MLQLNRIKDPYANYATMRKYQGQSFSPNAKIYSPNTAKHHRNVAESAAFSALEGFEDSPFKTPDHVGYYEQLVKEYIEILHTCGDQVHTALFFLRKEIAKSPDAYAELLRLQQEDAPKKIEFLEIVEENEPSVDEVYGAERTVLGSIAHVNRGIMNNISISNLNYAGPDRMHAQKQDLHQVEMPPHPAHHTLHSHSSSLQVTGCDGKENICVTYAAHHAVQTQGQNQNQSLSTQGKKEFREKIYVPTDVCPGYNFVGRLLGPQGSYLKTLETRTNCKFFIRGQGSMKNRAAEQQRRGQPGFEHLNEPLHVIVQASDEEAFLVGLDTVKQHLVPIDESQDLLKHQQLRQLAIIRGNYSVAKDFEFSRVPTNIL